MGRVFLAQDMITGKKVAVKIVKNQDQWEREREILKKLSHITGVPKLFFAGEKEEKYLVMEYISGESMKRYLKHRGKLSKKSMVLWMIRICRVLEKIHKRGIIHMDLKPENIIIRGYRKVYLIDFGVSLMKGQKLTGYGTRMYSSKKLIKPGLKAEEFMDIYSLGKIMQIHGKDFKDAQIQRIIQKCLSEEEEFGYHEISELKKDLRNLLWKSRMKKSTLFIAGVLIMQYMMFLTDKKEKQDQSVVISKKKSHNEMEKGMAYFYGTDQIKKDLGLAKQYFMKETKQIKKKEAYLLLLDLLEDDQRKISKEKLLETLKFCQMDANDFWSSYFFVHYEILWEQKLSQEGLQSAQEMMKNAEKYAVDQDKKDLLEKERLNLYELLAQRGDNQKFLEETNKVLQGRQSGGKAWEIYERKISYLEEKGRNLEPEFEQFLRKYPKVMEAYISYVIYLCQHDQIEKAKEIYLLGQKQTGMKDIRAQRLRRKLGL